MVDRDGRTSTLDWDLAGQASQTTVRYSFTDSPVPLCTRVLCDTCTYIYVSMFVRTSSMLALSQDWDRRKYPVGTPKVQVPESLLYTQYIIGFLCNTHTSSLLMTVNDDRSSVHVHKHIPRRWSFQSIPVVHSSDYRRLCCSSPNCRLTDWVDTYHLSWPESTYMRTPSHSDYFRLSTI